MTIEPDHEAQLRDALAYQRKACRRQTLLCVILLSWVCFIVSVIMVGVSVDPKIMIPITCISGGIATVLTVGCLYSCSRSER